MLRQQHADVAGDLFDGSLLLQDVGAELWEVERKAGPKLTVMWGTDVDDFDPSTQVRLLGRVGKGRIVHSSTEWVLKCTTYQYSTVQ